MTRDEALAAHRGALPASGPPPHIMPTTPGSHPHPTYAPHPAKTGVPHDGSVVVSQPQNSYGPTVSDLSEITGAQPTQIVS